MQTYQELTIPQKVQAILAAVQEPVSKEYSLHLGQIESSTLETHQLVEMERIFSNPDVEVTQGEELKYRLSDASRAKLAESVDMVSVHRVISDTLLEDAHDIFFGIDDL